MNYWLLKSEPEVFGIEHLAACKRQSNAWDGVRNYQARNYLRDRLQVGDLAFFYHSSCAVPGIAGVVGVTRAGYPDATAFDRKHPHYDALSKPPAPRWYVVDVQLRERFDRIVTLDELRAHQSEELREMLLLRPGNRLSVMPVSEAHWRFIHSLK